MTVIFQVHNMKTEVPTSVCHSVDVNTEEQTDYFPFQPVVGTICKAILCTHAPPLPPLFVTICLSHQLFACQGELSFQKYHRSGKEVQGEES